MSLRTLKGIKFSLQIHRTISVNSNSFRYCSTQIAKSSEQRLDTEREVQHHSKYAGDWWDTTNGPMRALHALNEIRVPFIRDGLVVRGSVNRTLINTTEVLNQQKILEVGCGGGILSEQIARLGAIVTAIDLGEDLIKAAKEHLKLQNCDLQNRITYKAESIELHAKDRCGYYDAVILSEVIEHIANKVEFLEACVSALRPGGSIFITTPNQTLPMWIGGVILAEYVLNITPKGTHHWDKLISPLDLQRILDILNCQTVLVNGSTYDFWRNTWRWINSTSMCYALQAIKKE